MNPLGNGNIGKLPPQVMQNIQQIKQMMNNPTALLQQNPVLSKILQTYKGQSPEAIFRSLCQQRGIDADAFIKELRN